MADAKPSPLAKLCANTIAAGPALIEAGPERRARWLAAAMHTLQDEASELGTQLRHELLGVCGLSAPMIAWALASTLSTFTTDTLLALDARCSSAHPGLTRARPGRLAVVVLSSNVFTAAARGVAIPLLFGWPVIAKTSSREDIFAPMLERALRASDPELAPAFASCRLAPGDEASSHKLWQSADALSVYGSDQTITQLRQQLGPTTSFIAHGHGLGVALIGQAALDNEPRAREVAQRLARDVAAYDQRGCLSPHAAWVVRGATVSPARFSLLLFEALTELRASWPRGDLPMAASSAQLAFRAEAAMNGTLHEGDGFAVAHRASARLHLSPGYRNVSILELDAIAQLAHELAPLGPHLKCLGIAGVPDLEALVTSLPARCAPRVCKLGTMQQPPLEALADGLPAWDGLVRFVDREWPLRRR